MNGTNVDHQTLFTYRPNYVLTEDFSHKNRRVNTHKKENIISSSFRVYKHFFLYKFFLFDSH